MNKKQQQQIKKLKKKKEKKKGFSYHLPTHKTFHLPSFLLLCNAIICVKDIKVVQFQTKVYYIIPRREFFTT